MTEYNLGIDVYGQEIRISRRAVDDLIRTFAVIAPFRELGSDPCTVRVAEGSAPSDPTSMIIVEVRTQGRIVGSARASSMGWSRFVADRLVQGRRVDRGDTTATADADEMRHPPYLRHLSGSRPETLASNLFGRKIPEPRVPAGEAAPTWPPEAPAEQDAETWQRYRSAFNAQPSAFRWMLVQSFGWGLRRPVRPSAIADDVGFGDLGEGRRIMTVLHCCRYVLGALARAHSGVSYSDDLPEVRAAVLEACKAAFG